MKYMGSKSRIVKYMGSKSRIVKSIAPIIQSYVDKSSGIYYEPFCGGCNVVDHITASKRIAADNNPYLIALLQNLDKLDRLPKFVTKEHYDSVRDSYNHGLHKYHSWYIGAIGFLASYNGRFFDGGYAGVVKTKSGAIRDYYAEALKNLKDQVTALKGVEFACRDYRDTPEMEGAVIYCDPPYSGVKQYGTSREFSHQSFWKWAREMSKKNIVLISEHTAPEDFKCIWEQPVKRTIDNKKRVDATEKMFIFFGNV